jgi:DNA polymerase III delta subunit
MPTQFPSWSCGLKFYDFLDKQPPIGQLVIVEGTERVLAEQALQVVLDRLLPEPVRELNMARFIADEIGDLARVREAVQAMPFLADRRVVVVAETQTLRAPVRATLWEVAQEVPEGNTLVLIDLLSPRSQRPQSFGALAGRAALRIDTTAGEETRERFVRETLDRLDAKAEPRAIDELARSQAELTAVRNDLEKLALAGKRITFKDLAREALTIEDP